MKLDKHRVFKTVLYGFVYGGLEANYRITKAMAMLGNVVRKRPRQKKLTSIKPKLFFYKTALVIEWNSILAFKSPNDNFVLCRPHGGLNDMLVQIAKCLVYSAKHNRLLYVDARKSGFMDDLGCYFIPPHNIRFGTVDFLPAPISVYPSCLTEDISNYKTKSYDNGDGRYGICEALTNEPITFDFKKAYAERVLVHEQAGGGSRGLYVLAQMKLQETVRKHIKTIIDGLGAYNAIHVRHSDYKTNYQAAFHELDDKLGQRIALCTDSYECQQYAKKLWRDRLYVVTPIPDTRGKPLHGNCALDRRQANIAALTDLFVLASSKELFLTTVSQDHEFPNVSDNFISGFGRLASSLHARQDIVARLIHHSGSDSKKN